MGKVGQWRVALQEMPEYSDGAAAFHRGERTATNPDLSGEAQAAYALGWSDALDEAALSGGAGNYRTYEE